MTIKGESVGTVHLLLELNLHQQLVARAMHKLRQAATHWKLVEQGIDDAKTFPPLDIILICVSCLSSAASIQRLLTIGKRNGPKAKKTLARCTALMGFLGQPALPTILSVKVRNSWEHMDERLDDILERDLFTSITRIHVSHKSPAPDTLVLRHFDPHNFEIKFADAPISLADMENEIFILDNCISTAFKKLNNSNFNVYS